MILYLASLVSLLIAGDQYRIADSSFGTRPDVGVTPLLFQLAGLTAGLGGIAMIIAGFFVLKWWAPIVGAAIAVAVMVILRFIVARHMSWLVAVIMAIIGAAFGGLTFAYA